jgi:dipeptidyl aminopeptidase/acylaminoacyl peptidase
MNGVRTLESRCEKRRLIPESHAGRARILLLCIAGCWPAANSATATKPQAGHVEAKRPITVDDMIGMSRLAGAPLFSPDGRQFLLVLKQGNVDKNTNEFSLLLYQSSQALTSNQPILLAKMASSSNREAISHVRWLADSEHIVFLGENPKQSSQVYEVNVRTRHVRALTSYVGTITNYDVTIDGRTLLFAADPGKKLVQNDMEEIERQGVVVGGQYLFDLLAQKYALSNLSELVYFQMRGHPPVQVAIDEPYVVDSDCRLSLSPDGRYAVIGAALRVVPRGWDKYRYGYIQEHLAQYAKESFTRYIFPFSVALLFDSSTAVVGPIMNAPAAGDFGRISPLWSVNSQSLFIHTYLPLDVSKGSDSMDRTRQQVGVEVKFPSKDFRIVTDDEWPKQKVPELPLHVTTAQSLNEAPRIYVARAKDQKPTLLLDPNPQFKDLAFGKVEVISFKVKDRIEVRCGLYLPPDYDPTRRYPLVIQTHGFYSKGFSMDGSLQEWSSAFAARALAAKGIIVLQAYEFVDDNDHDRYLDDKSLGVTPEQAARNLFAAVVEAAIEYLDQQAIIARDRVGIVGFSRTVGMVEYMLTHSTFRFAAANLVDGTDFGYFQLIAFPNFAWDDEKINGDVAPFGKGLETWVKESPSFSLDKISAPVRLVALKPAGVLEQWECYAGLLLQNKPVDFVLIPDPDEDGSNHLLVKPWEKRIAQQGLVDWFCFWLNEEEDRDPRKADQYVRWRQLRQQQDREKTGRLVKMSIE